MDTQLLPRHPKESARAYSGMLYFAQMGPKRSLQRLSDYMQELDRAHEADPENSPAPPSTSLDTIKKWSQKYNWQARARAYDAKVVEERTAQQINRLIERDEQNDLEWSERWAEWQQEAYDVAQELLGKARAILSFPLAEAREVTDENGQRVVIMPTKKWSVGTAAVLMKTSADLTAMTTGRAPANKLQVSGPHEGPINTVTEIVNSELAAGEKDRAVSTFMDALRDFLPDEGDAG